MIFMNRRYIGDGQSITSMSMTLKLKINVIVGAMTFLFIVAAMGLQLRSLRTSVHEEVFAANRVAAQMLERTVRHDSPQSGSSMLGFLQGIGRIRSNDITLHDPSGRLLYSSPPSLYKVGREAPAWFDRMVAPGPSQRSIESPDGVLVVKSNASRAVLDAWDDATVLAGAALVLLVVVNALVFWLVGRAVRPFRQIVAALNRLQGGRFDVQLPRLAGTEALAIGVAFNRMVGELQRHIEAERRAVRAELQLSDSRELTHWLGQHIERERHLIARELHDELGQSVTAMRSMALSIAQRVQGLDPSAEAAARLIADESSRLYDAMHGIIPRLTPLLLDNFGLGEALDDLVERTRRSQPEVEMELLIELGGATVSSEAALALYRVAQEGISNALRHGQAHRIRLTLTAAVGALTLTVCDDGVGLAPDWSKRIGHYGLRWLAERVEALGGELRVEAAEPRGVQLQALLPLDLVTSAATGITAVEAATA